MCIRTTQATAALQARIIRYDSREGLAQELGINSAHVHKLFQRGKLSPTLDASMVAHGWLEPKPTRTRVAFDATPEMQQWAADERARQGIDSQQLLVDMRAAYEGAGWISVDERLPEVSDLYIVFDLDYGRGISEYSTKEGWLDSDTVTHWQPLPPPPEAAP